MTDSTSEVSPSVARLVADAADAFQARRARGEDPDPEEYASRYPEAAEAIRGVLNVLRLAPITRASPPDDPPPRILGDFRIGQEVGRGGMGVVYEAEQISLGRRVALKVLPYAALVQPRLLQRFQNEARAAAGLDHPHVVKVYAVGQDRSVHFIAMQFIDGRPLSKFIRAVHEPETSGPTTGTWMSLPSTVPAARASTMPDARSEGFLRRAVVLAAQAADGLEHAHSFGVIHRDVKPGNLLIDDVGNLWVSDFGLAKVAAADGGVTGTGDVFGTLRYMSPEQAQAKHDLVDQRTDIYSLGATLYELLTGRPAVPGTDKVEILRQITDIDPIPVRRLNRSVPRDLETVVHKCLRKEAIDRYASAKELADDLRRFVNSEPVKARPVGSLGRLTRWRRRNPGLAVSISVAAVALLAVTGLSAGWAMRERDNAQELSTWAMRERDNAREISSALDQAQYRLAENYLDQGVWRCETGDVRAGLLWMARALEKAPPSAERLQETIRMQLAGWSADVAPLVAAVDCPKPITAAALNPDGKIAWIAGQDHVIRRWDIGRGSLTDGPTKLPDLARSLLWCPDGSTVVSVTQDKVVQRWDVETGEPIGPPLARGVLAAAWAPDGTFLVTGDADGAVRRWDRRTGAVLRPEIPRTGPVRGVAVSPNGRTLLTTDGKKVRFWDIETGLESGKPLDHTANVAAVVYGPEGRSVLTVCDGDGRSTQAWDTIKRQPLGRPVRHGQVVGAIVFDPSGRRYLTGARERTVRSWEASTGEALGTTITLPGPHISLCIGGDGLLLTASLDGAVRLWDAASKPERELVLQHKLDVTSAAFSPNGQLVLTGSFDGTARLWDVTTDRVVATMPHPNMVTGVAFSPDGRRALTICWDGRVRRWDGATGRELDPSISRPSRILRAAFSRDGQTILTGDDGGTVAFWGAEPGTERSRAVGHRGSVTAAAICPEQGWIATGGADGRVRLWNPTTGHPVGPEFRPGAAVNAIAFDPAGTVLAAGCDDRRAFVWDTTNGQPVCPPLIHGSEVCTTVFSPDGQILLTGCDDGTARLWDVPAGRPRGRTLGHNDRVCAGAFCMDGRTVLTGSRDGTARLWDAETGKPLGPPLTRGSLVRVAAFAPDGRVLTGSGNGVTRLWTAHTSTAGSATEVGRWIQMISGLGLDENDVSHVLSAGDWQALRHEPTQLGKPHR
jgi:eukaryotic-like serine/threonine-protein kinase